MTSALFAFLAPRSLAVIGASKDPKKRGYQALHTLLADRFAGKVYPINPKEQEILGLQVYPSVMAVADEIDLALICTPGRMLPDLLRDCGAKGIRGAVILAAGFSEIGAEGKRLEEEALRVAREHNIRLIGPNTNGIFNLHKRMNLVGVSGAVPGGLGIVSQSGNMMLALVAEARRLGQVGFSTYIGVGNQADIRLNEYLEYFGDDDQTAVPIFYVEGFKNGRRFLEIARQVTQRKPVVIYKSGRTEAGQQSARSHTGSLGGSYQMAVDLLRQAGVTVVSETDKILSVAEALSTLPLPAGKSVAVLADSGGHGTIATDAIIEAGLRLATLSEQTRVRLRQILPPAASLSNPIDVAGGTDENPGVFADCADVILKDEGVDMLLVIGMFGGYALRYSETLTAIELETSQRLTTLAKQAQKPILVQSVYAPLDPEPMQILRRSGIPVHSWVETTVACAAALAQYAHAKRRNAVSPSGKPQAACGMANAILARAGAGAKTALLETEARDLLAAHGIAVPRHVLLRSPEDVTIACATFGRTKLAAKLVSPDILHKSDAGGVMLDLEGEAELRAAYETILRNAKAHDPAAKVEGVLVTPMAPVGVEVIIGALRDSVFGPVIMFGLGGIFVEVLKDVVFRAIPLSRADAEEMLDEIKGTRVLDGVRGTPAVDRAALVDLLLQVSRLVEAHPEIAEIDLNPVMAYADGYKILDVRALLQTESSGHAAA
jgi:acetate---CoA ligase (ADP-forming)